VTEAEHEADQPHVTVKQCLHSHWLCDLMATLRLPLLGQPCVAPCALAVYGNDKIHDVTVPLRV
jgi:hypothetical protein